MSGFVYIWFDSKRKMYYIGSHTGDVNDGYICSSNRMRNAYNRRPQDFKRKILKMVEGDRKDVLNEEQIWLDKVKQKHRYYNLNFSVKSPWWSDPILSEIIRKKISDVGRGRILSEETKRKISESSKGKMIGENQRKLASEDKKNRIFMSNIELNKTKHVKIDQIQQYIENGWYKGRLPGWKSGEQNPRYGIASPLKGRPGPNLGRVFSEEYRKKKSENVKGKVWCNDGINSKQVWPNKIPENWSRGRIKKTNV